MLAFLKFAEIYISSSKGVYIVSFLSGLADTDAITISLAQAAGNSISYGTARNGIILGVLANVATKGCIAFVFGERIQQHSSGHLFTAYLGGAGADIHIIRMKRTKWLI